MGLAFLLLNIFTFSLSDTPVRRNVCLTPCVAPHVRHTPCVPHLVEAIKAVTRRC